MAFDWKSVVGTVAPTLATALGGPLAGMAVKAAALALGLGDKAGEKDLAAALATASPDQLLALKKADQDFAATMKSLDVNLEEIAFKDRDSARRMQMETRSLVPAVLAAIVISGFCTACAAILAGYVDGLKDPITAALVGSVFGQIAAAAMLVLNFYFGTSASSKAKDDTIKSLSK